MPCIPIIAGDAASCASISAAVASRASLIIDEDSCASLSAAAAFLCLGADQCRGLVRLGTCSTVCLHDHQSVDEDSCASRPGSEDSCAPAMTANAVPLCLPNRWRGLTCPGFCCRGLRVVTISDHES